MTSFLYVVSYCHLSATLQTISITVVNLQDNRAVFRIFIALLRFSFDSPSYYIITPEDNYMAVLHASFFYLLSPSTPTVLRRRETRATISLHVKGKAFPLQARCGPEGG